MSKGTCPLCITQGVNPPREITTRGMCQPHYQHARRNGLIEPVYRKRGDGNAGLCEADCSLPAAVKGLCRPHYARKRNNVPNWDSPLPENTKGMACTASWTNESGETVVCGGPNHARGLCGTHSWQKRKGYPFTPITQRKSPGGPCSACLEWGDKRTARHDGLCGTHYDRRRREEQDWDRPIRAKSPDGGGYLTHDGYRKVYVDGVRVLEHVHLAEVGLRRKLYPGENVHHKNGNRSDNRVDGPFVLTADGKLLSGNLEVWSTKQPAGQEIGPKLDWAFEMITEYLPQLTGEHRARLSELATHAGLLGEPGTGGRDEEAA